MITPEHARFKPDWDEVAVRTEELYFQLLHRTHVLTPGQARRNAQNGPGLLRGRSGARVQGMGIANVQARLSHLYGTEHALEFRNRPEGGLAVTLVIPFRVEAADDDDGGGEDQRK